MHVAGMEPEDGVRMSGTVVEEVRDGLGCSLSAFGLGRGNGAEGNEHGGVNGTCVVKESANNFLNAGDSRGGKRGRSVRWGSKLSGGTIRRGKPGVG